jgi:hypothetical protein
MRKMGPNPFDKSVLEIGQNIKRRVNKNVNSQMRNDTFNPGKQNSNDLAT